MGHQKRLNRLLVVVPEEEQGKMRASWERNPSLLYLYQMKSLLRIKEEKGRAEVKIKMMLNHQTKKPIWQTALDSNLMRTMMISILIQRSWNPPEREEKPRRWFD